MKDAEREVGNDMFTQKFMQEIERSFEAQLNRLGAVSYTHLDVYKRQLLTCA